MIECEDTQDSGSGPKLFIFIYNWHMQIVKYIAAYLFSSGDELKALAEKRCEWNA